MSAALEISGLVKRKHGLLYSSSWVDVQQGRLSIAASKGETLTYSLQGAVNRPKKQVKLEVRIMEGEEKLLKFQFGDEVERDRWLQVLEANSISTAGIVSANMQERYALIRLQGLTDVPRMDAAGHCDPYVKMWLANHEGQRLSSSVSWPARHGCKNPVWNSVRGIEWSHDDAGLIMLQVEVWDEDRLSSDDLIAVCLIPWLDLSEGHMLTFRMPCRRQERKECSISLQLATAASAGKWVFLVRHGQSVWNQAQAERDVKKMVRQTDHPLNRQGYQQADDLRKRVTEALASTDLPEDDYEASAIAALRSVELVCSSPLTRAVETALVAMYPLLMRTRYLQLLPNARERRNLGGRDSSGDKVGDGIKARVLRCLEEFAGPQVVEQCAAFTWDMKEVEDKWWDNIPESAKDVVERQMEFLNQLQFSAETNIVVVGHSHFFRELFRGFLHPSFVSSDPGFCQDLQERILCNAGVAALWMDFHHPLTPISSVRLLMGTYLV
eukprot:NODE_1180_length_1659_cov_31.291925_g1047_i0.p1 GENE.NODE_1180_length_1659_cov_31.291925_g1047_i0~~NODE_1180_length_1659_cov_31.291925_g1047_i0.p1  ORF type:complete len:497 (+),score=80.10 NODE_1180_length_1659_cov_31.291925_g1047_i0:103-1593(+)